MSISKYGLFALKGCAMGMADVVPGVSGGTIAFISGIYGELIDSIKSLNLHSLKLLGELKFAEFFRYINGKFLFSVLAGIAVAIFSLANLMTYLLVNHPIAIWSFFFGLIIASSILVAKEVGKWNVQTGVSLIVGIVAAYWVTVASPAETPNEWWFVMISGAVAICAMILPGISGAFILLLMGKYQYLMQAVSSFDISVIVVFVIGAVVGIISFSHLLSWLLKHRHDITIAVLMGFMIGSLNKVWPWKETLETYKDNHGMEQPLVQANILPTQYESLTGNSSLLWQAIALCVAGFLLIYIIERVGTAVARRNKTND